MPFQTSPMNTLLSPATAIEWPQDVCPSEPGAEHG